MPGRDVLRKERLISFVASETVACGDSAPLSWNRTTQQQEQRVEKHLPFLGTGSRDQGAEQDGVTFKVLPTLLMSDLLPYMGRHMVGLLLKQCHRLRTKY